MKIALPERVERLTRWFHRENDRPLLGFYMDSQYPLHCFRGSRKSLPEGMVRPEHVVVADYLDDCDRLFELYEAAGGDLIWSVAPFWGIPWVEAALGCGVRAKLAVGATESLPPPGFAEKPVVPEFSADNPWVARMLEFIPAMEARSAGRYPVGVTLMRGISDLLSALYGGERLLIRMLEAPEEVADVSRRLTDFWIAFGRCLQDHVHLFHGGTGSFFYSLWCPGRTIWTQEDAAALLSPSLYEKFIHPATCRIADAFEHSVIHLHPSRFIPVDYLMRTHMSVIELHIDRGGPSAEELCGIHKKVLVEKPLFIWGDVTRKDIEFILKNLPHKGLAINMVASSPDETRDIWDAFSGLLRKRP